MFNQLKILFSSLASFLQANYLKIIVAFVITTVLFSIYYLSTASLKKLKLESFQNYPFRLFFPQSSSWSTGYFIIVIVLLGLLVYFGLEGKFFLGPA